MRRAGFDEEAIADAVGVATCIGMSSRLAKVTNLRPNDELHAMGRG